MGANQERPLAVTLASHDPKDRGGAPKVKIGRDCNVGGPGPLPAQPFLRVALIIYNMTREAHWLK